MSWQQLEKQKEDQVLYNGKIMYMIKLLFVGILANSEGRQMKDWYFLVVLPVVVPFWFEVPDLLSPFLLRLLWPDIRDRN